MAGLGVVALAVVAAGCGTSSRAASPSTSSVPAGGTAGPSPTASAPRPSGPVSVLYAGSLVGLMEKQIGPGFRAATGYNVDGYSAGSTALAAQIKGQVRQGDVLISASPAVNTTLEGAQNGNWVSWYATFAKSPLVLGYNPGSRFAQAIRSEPWYQALARPGILVGRTDPATDPKGKLTVAALDGAARRYGQPTLAAVATSLSDVYPEETLVGRLQAGQLDAGFLYSSEAAAASIPSVPVTVPGLSLAAVYTVTILAHAPDQSGARAFVNYLLGPAGRAALQKDGFELAVPPRVVGTGAPEGLIPRS